MKSEIIAAGNKTHDFSYKESAENMLVFWVKIPTDQGKPQEIPVRMSCTRKQKLRAHSC
jgi:hypothetical protein